MIKFINSKFYNNFIMIHPFLFFEKYILPDIIMLYFYVGSNSVGTCTCSHVYVCRYKQTELHIVHCFPFNSKFK